jgi:hypothetical protein
MGEASWTGVFGEKLWGQKLWGQACNIAILSFHDRGEEVS